MRRDHRPYAVKRAFMKLENAYASRFLRPQFDRLGRGWRFMGPWHVSLFGGPIELGAYATVIATGDARVRLSVWSAAAGQGRISIGDCCLICPGVRVSSASAVHIGDGTLLANGVYITDADWHGLYDRVSPGASEPVRIGANVWLGDSVIVCKGVSIGDDSVVGAGSVVVGDIPPGVVAAGNPARVVKPLDSARPMVTRMDWYADPAALSRDFRRWDRETLQRNTLLHWMRHLVRPRRGE